MKKRLNLTILIILIISIAAIFFISYYGSNKKEISFSPPTLSIQHALEFPAGSKNFISAVNIVSSGIQEVKFQFDGINSTYYDDDLVLRYNFNNLPAIGESSTKVVDVSKYGNNGTVHNYKKLIVGNGKADFTQVGTGKFIDAPNSNSLNLGRGDFSIGLWIIFPINGDSSWEGIISKNYFTSARAKSWGIVRNYTSTTSIAYQDVNTAGSFFANYRSSHFSNGAHYFAVTRKIKGTNSIYNFYEDGILKQTIIKNAIIDLTNTNPLLIGMANGRYFNGTIGEVQIWKRVLSENEIKELFAMSSLQKTGVNTWVLYANKNNLADGEHKYSISAKNANGEEGSSGEKRIIIENKRFQNPDLGEQKITAIVVTLGSKKSIDGFSDPVILLNKTYNGVFVELNKFIQENSYNKSWITGKVIGPYDIGEDICDLNINYGEKVNEIVKRATESAGSNILPNSKIIVFHPYPGCDFSNSPRQIMTFDEFIVAHEFGHSLGYGERHIGHISSLYCKNDSGQHEILSNNCEEEVFDPYDLMGMGWPSHFNSINKEIFGWLNEENFVFTNSGTYTITPIELNNVGLKAIKVPLPNMRNQLYIEFRIPDKVIIHTKRNIFFSNYFVLPNDNPQYTFLIIGKNYTIEKSGITIKVEEINRNNWARVKISSRNLSKTQCNDEIDNDDWNDWLYDEQDFSCLNEEGVYNASQLSEFEPMPECGDNIDNDGDGIIDTVSQDCNNPQDDSE